MEVGNCKVCEFVTSMPSEHWRVPATRTESLVCTNQREPGLTGRIQWWLTNDKTGTSSISYKVKLTLVYLNFTAHIHLSVEWWRLQSVFAHFKSFHFRFPARIHLFPQRLLLIPSSLLWANKVYSSPTVTIHFICSISCHNACVCIIFCHSANPALWGRVI